MKYTKKLAAFRTLANSQARPLLFAATADGITTVQPDVSAAAKTLPTTPTRER